LNTLATQSTISFGVLTISSLSNTLLHVPWPPSLLGDAFPQLRSMLAGLI
jgi:hypothetical protein